MKEPQKKKIIVILLFISCFVSGYSFFSVSDHTAKHLQSFAQADSLIRQELALFNIRPHQIQTESIVIDSSFSRKVFHVEVPDYLSKTEIHAELNETFYPFAVKTPGRVLFPDKHIKIHLVYQDTIIRTLFLKAQES